MKTYALNSPVVLFNHNEYGQRLLFQKGITNPRDILGKNGVTIHGWFGSIFYKTIQIRATLIGTNGEEQETVFNLNRNSLIKYLGSDVADTDTDEDITKKLNATLWTNDNNANGEQKQKQADAGTEGLRHAGRYNERPVRKTFWDSFLGSFLSWLYQKTIGSVNLRRIKVRFFFVGTEKKLLKAGEILAKQRFHETYAHVPAYKIHLTNYNGVPTAESLFRDIPSMDKSNYIKIQDFDADTHFYGKYPIKYKTDTSTGTTGKPTEWVRGAKELETVKESLRLAARIQFGKRRLNYINAFALGPWATGMTSYELMRDTGSVFATGPDKDKILDKLTSIAKYEERQLTLAVEQFVAKHPNITAKAEIIKIVKTILQTLLKERRPNIDKVLSAEMTTADEPIRKLFRQHYSEIKAFISELNREKTQMIIAGYPPFLKDLIDYAKAKNINFSEFSIIGVVGGQAISEAMRDQLIHHGFKQVLSSYGASDLDINLGIETEYEVTVRKAVEQNPGLARELYGENKGLPMVFHYDPMNYHVECDDKDNLLFTCTRSDRSSPRIRYDLGDKGRVYASSDIQALLCKYGIFQKPKSNLPFMLVWGRDSTVVFNGANLAFTELERAVTTDEELERMVLKKAFYTYEDEEGLEKLEIWLELNEGEDLPNEEQMQKHAHSILSNLVNLNQDFHYQVEKLNTNTLLPMIRFYKRHQSPISEAGGHRKQVLIFQKGVNLNMDYEFPAPENCCGIAIPKTDAIFNTERKMQFH